MAYTGGTHTRSTRGGGNGNPAEVLQLNVPFETSFFDVLSTTVAARPSECNFALNSSRALMLQMFQEGINSFNPKMRAVEALEEVI